MLLIKTQLTATRFTAPALSPATAQRIQAAANTFIPMRMGETSESVKVLQQALIDLGDARFNLASGATGVYSPETYQAVFNFQAAYHLQQDGEVGGETLGKLNDLYAAPGVIVASEVLITGPTHQEVIDRAFTRSRESVRNVLGILLRFEADIAQADSANGNDKTVALANIGRLHARDIAVLSDRLKIGSDPLSSQFRDGLAKARSLVQRNLAATSNIIEQGDSGRCAAGQYKPPGVPFAATTASDPDPRVSVCTPFFAGTVGDDDLKRDILTHEFFHLVGCADVENPTTTDQLLNNAHTMAMVVSYLNDRHRQANKKGGDAYNPPLPVP